MAFRDPILSGEQLMSSGMHSEDYVEGTSGWRIGSDGQAQFYNVDVIGQAGITDLSVDTLAIGGNDFGSYFDPLPLGVICYSYLYSGDRIGDAGATELVGVIASMGSVKAGRLYKIGIQGHFQAQGTIATTETYDLRMRYTNDGSNPTIASGMLAGGTIRINVGSPQTSADFSHNGFYSPIADYDTFKVGLTIQRAGGTGTGGIYQGASDRRLIIWVEDCGLYAAALQAGTISQRLKVSNAAPDPDPIQAYTKSYTSNWWRSYDSDNGTRTGDDDQNKLYQGYYSSTHGRTYSAYGLPYAQIASDTSGATMTAAKLTFKVRYRAYSSGLDINVFGHDYTAKPSSFVTSHATYGVASRANSNQGSTYTIDLGVTTANRFKAGTYKGLGFYATDNGDDQYGYMYGSSSPPKLTLTYSK